MEKAAARSSAAQAIVREKGFAQHMIRLWQHWLRDSHTLNTIGTTIFRQGLKG